MSSPFAALPFTQRAILSAIKGEGPLPLCELAGRLGLSYEAVRQQVGELERGGWLRATAESRLAEGAGRPYRLYGLTAAGDHLFPKHYDDLALELLDTVASEMGAEALRGLLAALAEARVRQLGPQLEGLALRERLEKLRAIYHEGDPFIQVETGPEGELRLVERNCPFLAVASRRPALCSVTVSVLSRLLGCRVVRLERFQDGKGRCVFQVLENQPLGPEEKGFEWEPEAG